MGVNELQHLLSVDLDLLKKALRYMKDEELILVETSGRIRLK